MELGYAPYDPTLDAPGDRRRFVSWATDRGVDFAVVEQPHPGIDVAVVSSVADLVRWRDAPSATRVVYDLTDDYLGLPASGLKNRARGVAKFLSGELSRPTLRYRELMADMCRRADVRLLGLEAAADLAPELGAHGDVLHVRVGRRQAAGGGARLQERRVDPRARVDQCREHVEVGLDELVELPPALDLRDDLVLVADRLQHTRVGREPGLAAALAR